MKKFRIRSVTYQEGSDEHYVEHLNAFGFWVVYKTWSGYGETLHIYNTFEEADLFVKNIKFLKPLGVKETIKEYDIE